RSRSIAARTSASSSTLKMTGLLTLLLPFQGGRRKLDREPHRELRPAGPRLHADRSVVLTGHDGVARGEAQARPLADRFGREEGIADPRLDVLGDARPVVLDLDDRPRVLAASPDPDLPAAVHRVGGVVEDVGPDLVQLAAERRDVRQVRGVVAP